uniref:Uncharacterized protein n=1 Tax=Utricularia reniformis TaxID=192314 RepID=A0A1Y0B4V7_9LAMI|nr:hypothetical protein AEK19_MT2285 [Utricularia reniformis]ART32430.1 hypothetical protein AEK19_MT2285 [Utricularia reniformis]
MPQKITSLAVSRSFCLLREYSAMRPGHALRELFFTLSASHSIFTPTSGVLISLPIQPSCI